MSKFLNNKPSTNTTKDTSKRRHPRKVDSIQSELKNLIDNKVISPSSIITKTLLSYINNKGKTPRSNSKKEGRHTDNKINKDNHSKVKILKGTQIPSLEKGSKFRTFLGITLGSITGEKSLSERILLENLAEKVVSVYIHLVKHHGVSEASARYKKLCNFTIAIAEGRNPEPLNWVATEKDIQIPTIFSFLKERIISIRSRHLGWEKRLQSLVTTMAIPRLSKAIPELDIDSIVRPFPSDKKGTAYDRLLRDFKGFIRTHWVFEDIPSITENYNLSPRMRLTKGPNGSVTLASSIEEAGALLASPVLWNSMKSYLTYVKCEDMITYISQIAETANNNILDTYLGKLVLVPDSLNKHRLVAMVDYWTNLILAPLEERIRELLKYKLHHTDYLRNHNEGAKKVIQHPGKSWSVDLSSFTDRFPADLQQIVVERLVGGNCGQHWRTLVCGRSYWSPVLEKYIKYSVGQPMGSKGSFAIASLAHHLLIHYGWSLLSKDHRSRNKITEMYVLVGDDVVFFDQLLMEKMKEVYITLDIEIQSLKSKVPVEISGNTDTFTEFCSRSSVNNHDISRLSPVLIRNASHNWQDIPALIIHAEDRGVELDMSLISDFLTLGSGALPPSDRTKCDRGLMNLRRLKTVLCFPLMGRDLTKFSTAITTEPLMVAGVEPWQVEQIVYNIQIFSAVLSIEDALNKYREELKLNGEEYSLLLEVDAIHAKDLTTPSIWKEGSSIRSWAGRDNFKVKGWKGEVPHPASIAAVYHTFSSTSMIARGLPGYHQDPSKPLCDLQMAYMGDLGRRTAAIDPKGAEGLLVTASDQGSFYTRRQVFLFHKVISSLKEGEENVVIKLPKLTVRLRVPTERLASLQPCLLEVTSDHYKQLDELRKSLDLLIDTSCHTERTYMNDERTRQALMQALMDED